MGAPSMKQEPHPSGMRGCQEAVTNTAGKALTKEIVTVRDLGLNVLHGIVDSVVVQGQ